MNVFNAWSFFVERIINKEITIRAIKSLVVNGDGWDLPTICYGHTKGVRKGDYKTDQECEELFKQDMKEACAIVSDAIGRDEFDSLTQGERDGYCLFAHNTGYFKLQRSGKQTSMYKRLMSHDREGACEALLMYDRANGKVLAGLIKKREFEYNRCMSGL